MGGEAALATWRARAEQGSEYFTVRRVAQVYMCVYESVVGSAVTTGRAARTRAAHS